MTSIIFTVFVLSPHDHNNSLCPGANKVARSRCNVDHVVFFVKVRKKDVAAVTQNWGSLIHFDFAYSPETFSRPEKLQIELHVTLFVLISYRSNIGIG